MTESTGGTTRRQAFGVAGASGVALLFAGALQSGGIGSAELAEAASATCALTPSKTIGPYFVDEKLNRSDVREAQAGTDLTLTLYLFDADNDCAPISGAQVDIWHASWQGKYSDESANGTVGETWLRGFQVTDAAGKVTFATKWPGWYSGRAVHIHFRVRTDSSDFTSQMFFTDAMNATVFASSPYSSRGNPDVSDGQDNILGSDAEVLTLHPTASGNGYAADFSVGLAGAPSATVTPTPTSSADTVVSLALRGARTVRLSGGRRQLRLRVNAAEAVTLQATLTRDGRRLAQRIESTGPGAHLVRVAIGRGVAPGAARLTLKARDAAGNSRSYQRSVHIPKQKA